MKTTIILTLLIGCIASTTVKAQTIKEEIRADANRSAGTFHAYPGPRSLTPPPEGKKPFFLNHYGCQGSYYLDQQSFYDQPYKILAKAESAGKLTPLGQDVMRRLDILRKDALNRTGELTELGAQQQRDIVTWMEEQFPETFDEKGYASGRSATVNRCILSMEEAMIQLARLRPTGLSHRSSHRYQPYMNPQDKKLNDLKMDSVTKARFKAFAKRHQRPERLMQALFNDQDYVKENVDATKLSEKLFNLAGTIQNTELRDSMTLFDIFTPEEIYDQWKIQNAWWYINYGGCTLNGGLQPYTSRALLRYMIEKGDSVSHMQIPITHLRFTLETVFMPLVCLMDINGYGLATDDLENLDEMGWADYRISPMSGNVMLIYYRSDYDDKDILMKVLLNGKEASLPIPTDCAPYYHWKDVREYYLKKLNAYEEE